MFVFCVETNNMMFGLYGSWIDMTVFLTFNIKFYNYKLLSIYYVVSS